MAYRLIINFPFQSVKDEQYVLSLHCRRDGAFANAMRAMDADRCFQLKSIVISGKDTIITYEGTLTGSVKAEDDDRDDLFAPLCASKLAFNVACQLFPAWLMDLCEYATNVRVVLYTVTDLLSNPIRERWRGYLVCNTLNMTVVNDLMSCPLVAVDEIGIAKYLPFRANCAGRPARLTLYGLLKKWWSMNWECFGIPYSDIGLPNNQAAMIWTRDAAIYDDDGNEIYNLLGALVINLEQYYLNRDATWENVLSDVCAYLGVHFCVGGYASNYSYDNYLITSYDSGTVTVYGYNLHTDTATLVALPYYANLGNQTKVGANLQITYTPDEWKGVAVKSTPTRPPMHNYLAHDNIKAITPATGHGEYIQTRIGHIGSGGKGDSLKYWRLIYTQIVNAENQWTDEADYIELDNCEVSDAGRRVGGDGYFQMTDAPLGRSKPSGEDTDSLEFVLEKNGAIPVRLGGFEFIDASLPSRMTDYLMILNNLWGRRYWSDDAPYLTDISVPFKVASIMPFGLDGSVLSTAKAYLFINFSAFILNENIAENDGIYEFTGTGYVTDMHGRDSSVFPILETWHQYEEFGHDRTTGRLSDDGDNYRIISAYPYLTVRLRIGNWFYNFDLENHTSFWSYYNDPDDAPTFKLPLIGNLDQQWLPNTGGTNNVVASYYYNQLEPKSGIFDSAFMVPLEGISTHGQPLEGRAVLEIWWPTPYLNYYTRLGEVYRNNILSILLNDIEIRYTDEAEIAGDDIETTATTVLDPSSDTKKMKEISLALATPKVEGVFSNCLLYDGGKAWHNLQAIHDSNSLEQSPEEYLSKAMAEVYNRPQMWIEFERQFAASDYGNIANIDFRVHSLTEAPYAVFVPVKRCFEYTKGLVSWKMQQISVTNPE